MTGTQGGRWLPHRCWLLGRTLVWPSLLSTGYVHLALAPQSRGWLPPTPNKLAHVPSGRKSQAGTLIADGVTVGPVAAEMCFYGKLIVMWHLYGPGRFSNLLFEPHMEGGSCAQLCRKQRNREGCVRDTVFQGGTGEHRHLLPRCVVSGSTAPACSHHHVRVSAGKHCFLFRVQGVVEMFVS